MESLDLKEHPHRRWNALTGEWILVSPHRAKRPWLGQIEQARGTVLQRYDPSCYLCPGNKRAGNQTNPHYTSTFVFDNDFSALQLHTPSVSLEEDGLLVAHGEPGICRVVCFSPRHDLTLAEMEKEDIRRIVDVWVDEHIALGAQPSINYVQIFENKGEVMGCSNPHPHGQIWAEKSIPVEPAKEAQQLQAFLVKEGRSLLAAYLEQEQRGAERMVFENHDFAVLVPFWAVWPFETLVVSKRTFGSIADMTSEERDSFGDALRRVTIRYDNLFNTPFPYSSGIHQAPTDGLAHPEWHFHMHFYPPLLRSATVKKFMVGYEMLANPQRDITPELSAARLRELPEAHYKRSSIQ